jgi:hypothetical protein
MATQHGYITIGFVDSTGVKASTNIPVSLDDTATLAVLQSAATALVAAAAALSECGVTEWRLAIIGSTTGLTTITPDSDANEGLLLNMNQAVIPRPQEYTIPSLIDALLVNGKIDGTNATLLAFTTLLAAANPLRGVSIAWNNITTPRDAAEAFRTLKRQATKKTRTTIFS